MTIGCGKGGLALAFVAKSGDHAIVEVVFGFQLSRQWSPAEIERLAQSHSRWKADLPRLSRHEVQQIMIGEGVPQAITLPGGPGISFERIKPDGEIAWRLRCEGNSIFVNCLEYTRWQETWAKASGFIRQILEAVGAEKIAVAGALLQYIDVFDWNADPKEYDIFKLLDSASSYVPKAIGDYGMTWHLHQGWFSASSEPVPARVLNKVHFDALQQNEKGEATVRLDTVLRSDFNGRIAAKTFFDEKSALEGVFVDLHDKNKQLLRGFLTNAVCEEIGLGEGQ